MNKFETVLKIEELDALMPLIKLGAIDNCRIASSDSGLLIFKTDSPPELVVKQLLNYIIVIKEGKIDLSSFSNNEYNPSNFPV